MSITFLTTTEPGGALVLGLCVLGKPEPQGSVRAFVPTYKSGEPMRRAGGSIVVNLTSDNPALKKWRKKVGEHAQFATEVLTAEPVEVDVTFFLERPKSQRGTGRNALVVKASAPAHHTTRPDVDKLLRALLDALTGVVWEDDSQVVTATARKRWAGPADEARTEVRVTLAP